MPGSRNNFDNLEHLVRQLLDDLTPEKTLLLALKGAQIAHVFDQIIKHEVAEQLPPVVKDQDMRYHEIRRELKQLTSPEGFWVLFLIWLNSPHVSADLLAAVGMRKLDPSKGPLIEAEVTRQLSEHVGIDIRDGVIQQPSRDRGLVERVIRSSKLFDLIVYPNAEQGGPKVICGTPRLAALMERIGVQLAAVVMLAARSLGSDDDPDGGSTA